MVGLVKKICLLHKNWIGVTRLIITEGFLPLLCRCYSVLLSCRCCAESFSIRANQGKSVSIFADVFPTEICRNLKRFAEIAEALQKFSLIVVL